MQHWRELERAFEKPFTDIAVPLSDEALAGDASNPLV
jgi:hypothetical protein